MASRRPPTGAPPPSAGGLPGNSSGRSHEYFLPRDGIDREVITADICRYLGNDALVRPGHYENANGTSIQGFYITAYRNLTTAMIEDLKADSARWESERRQQAARNAPAGYRESATHNHRQAFGPTSASGSGGYPDGRDSYDNPRYPGSIAPGYSGNPGSGGYGQPPQTQTPYSSAPPGYTYPAQAPGGSSYSSQPDPRYGSSSQPSGYTGREPPYISPVNMANSQPRYEGEYGSAPPQARGPPGPVSQQPGNYPTSAATASQPSAAYAQNPYYASNQPSAYGGAPPAQPHDPYSRGAYSSSRATPPGRAPSNPLASPAGPSQPYNSNPGQPYDAATRSSVPPSSTQMASSGSSHSSRRERDPSDRHHDRHRPSRR